MHFACKAVCLFRLFRGFAPAACRGSPRYLGPKEADWWGVVIALMTSLYDRVVQGPSGGTWSVDAKVVIGDTADETPQMMDATAVDCIDRHLPRV